MTTTVTGLFATARDEYGDVAVLSAGSADPADDLNVFLGAPQGFGDYLLLEAAVYYVGIDTLRALPADYLYGVAVGVSDNSGLIVAPVGAAMWIVFNSETVNATRALIAQVEPDQPVLVRSQETIVFQVPLMDTAAVPTSDVLLFARVKRLRQLGPQTSIYGPP